MHIEEGQLSIDAIAGAGAIYVVDPLGQCALIKANHRLTPFVSAQSDGTNALPTLEVRVPELNESNFNRVRAALRACGIPEVFLEEWH